LTCYPTRTASVTKTVRAGANGCVEDVNPGLIDDIANHPGAYYVNIHTSRFPGGAIRGNLERSEVGIWGK
jgi:CHRD domain